jgi:hypothetical protein
MYGCRVQKIEMKNENSVRKKTAGDLLAVAARTVILQVRWQRWVPLAERLPDATGPATAN